MKRLITLTALIACSLTMSAQHKLLKQINIHDIYLNGVGASKTYNIGSTQETYTAYFYDHRNSIYHTKGIKAPDLGYDSWSLNVEIDLDEAIALLAHALMKESSSDFWVGLGKIKITVGESTYTIDDWYYSSLKGHRLLIEINKSIAHHIGISGLQGIMVGDIEIIALSEIEQELWRRSAKDVYETRKNL